MESDANEENNRNTPQNETNDKLDETYNDLKLQNQELQNMINYLQNENLLYKRKYREGKHCLASLDQLVERNAKVFQRLYDDSRCALEMGRLPLLNSPSPTVQKKSPVIRLRPSSPRPSTSKAITPPQSLVDDNSSRSNARRRLHIEPISMQELQEAVADDGTHESEEESVQEPPAVPRDGLSVIAEESFNSSQETIVNSSNTLTRNSRQQITVNRSNASTSSSNASTSSSNASTSSSNASTSSSYAPSSSSGQAFTVNSSHRLTRNSRQETTVNSSNTLTRNSTFADQSSRRELVVHVNKLSTDVLDRHLRKKNRNKDDSDSDTYEDSFSTASSGPSFSSTPLKLETMRSTSFNGVNKFVNQRKRGTGTTSSTRTISPKKEKSASPMKQSLTLQKETPTSTANKFVNQRKRETGTTSSTRTISPKKEKSASPMKQRLTLQKETPTSTANNSGRQARKRSSSKTPLIVNKRRRVSPEKNEFVINSPENKENIRSSPEARRQNPGSDNSGVKPKRTKSKPSPPTKRSSPRLKVSEVKTSPQIEPVRQRPTRNGKPKNLKEPTLRKKLRRE